MARPVVGACGKRTRRTPPVPPTPVKAVRRRRPLAPPVTPPALNTRGAWTGASTVCAETIHAAIATGDRASVLAQLAQCRRNQQPLAAVGGGGVKPAKTVAADRPCSARPHFTHTATTASRNRQGDTYLLAAVRRGMAEVALALLDHGADPFATGRHGESVLAVAAAQGPVMEEMCLALLARGADVDVHIIDGPDSSGAPSPMVIVNEDSCRGSRMGADSTDGTHGYSTYIHTDSASSSPGRCLHMDDDIVGCSTTPPPASVGAADAGVFTATPPPPPSASPASYGITPSPEGVGFAPCTPPAGLGPGSPESDAGSHPLRRCAAPLISAIEHHMVSVCLKLMEMGADASTPRAASGASALHLACTVGLHEVCHALVQHGVDVGVEDNHGDTAMLAAQRSARAQPKMRGVVAALRAAGADEKPALPAWTVGVDTNAHAYARTHTLLPLMGDIGGGCVAAGDAWVQEVDVVVGASRSRSRSRSEPHTSRSDAFTEAVEVPVSPKVTPPTQPRHPLPAARAGSCMRLRDARGVSESRMEDPAVEEGRAWNDSHSHDRSDADVHADVGGDLHMAYGPPPAVAAQRFDDATITTTSATHTTPPQNPCWVQLPAPTPPPADVQGDRHSNAHAASLGKAVARAYERAGGIGIGLGHGVVGALPVDAFEALYGASPRRAHTIVGEKKPDANAKVAASSSPAFAGGSSGWAGSWGGTLTFTSTPASADPFEATYGSSPRRAAGRVNTTPTAARAGAATSCRSCPTGIDRPTSMISFNSSDSCASDDFQLPPPSSPLPSNGAGGCAVSEDPDSPTPLDGDRTVCDALCAACRLNVHTFPYCAMSGVPHALSS